MFVVFWAFVPPALIVLGCLLLWAASWLRQPRRPAGHVWGAGCVYFLGWLILLTGIVTTTLLTTDVLAPIIWIVVGYVLAMGLLRYWHSEIRFLIWTLSEAAERGIPLETAARAYANERRGRLADRARLMADYLDAAMPLSLAMARSRLFVSREIQLAADVGEKTGTLSQSLKKIMQEMNDLERVFDTLFARFFYLGCLVSVMALFLSYLMLTTVPRLEAIFLECGLTLPWVTQVLTSSTRLLVNYWHLCVPVLAALALLAFLALFRFLGTSARLLPVVGRLFSPLNTVSIQQLLAVTVREKRPLVGSLELLATHCPASRARSRLHGAIRRITSGEHWCDALRRARFMSRAQCAVFRSAEQAGNLAWALNEMADSRVRRAAHRAQAVLSVLFPLGVFGLALCVLFVMLSIVMPLFNLISGLA